MNSVLKLEQGSLPLLISMPHAGLRLTPAVEQGLVAQARELPDTDWHIPRLYDFAHSLGASVLAAQYSRFVIDLNRPADDRPLYAGATTGLFPCTLFEGAALFEAGQAPDYAERAGYLENIWKPYHQAIATELRRLQQTFGYALLWDAHSIRSQVPRLFDGRLPDFNLGTFDGASCAPELASVLAEVCAAQPAYSHVLNGRFKGGHITRHYGDPARRIHAVQLELTQRCYMDEQAPFRYREDLAVPTREVLQRLLQACLDWGRKTYAQ